MVSKKVIGMETSLKVLSGAKGRYGLIKNLGAILRRATAITSQNALPYEMFEKGLPYEASKTYRTMKSEFECQRSGAMVEACRLVIRGL